MEEFIKAVVYVLSGIFGLCIGSFLNVVIYRVPNDMNIALPASHCPKCGYVLKWYDNIPIISYIILGGKCRSCKDKISFRYTAVEILNTVLWLGCVYAFWDKSIFFAVLAAIYCSVLLCIAFIDLENMFIPVIFLIIGICIGIAAIFSGDGILWHERLIGLGVGGGVFALAYFGSKLILKREGLGVGDIELMAGAGLLLGWKGTIFSILIAAVTGSIVLLTVKAVRKDEKQTEYPFAPFLALGILVALFFAEPVIGWYTGLFGI